MKLFYREFGSGEPIIILHGLYGQSDNWIQIARALSNNYHVILPDHRNHGSSPHSEEHTYLAMSDDLKELMDQLSISETTILGHSMGGKVAMQFAALHPERVSALIIADIAPKDYLDIPGSNSHLQNHKEILSSLESLSLQEVVTRKDADILLSERIPSPSLRQFLLKNLRRTTNGFEWKINIPALTRSLQAIIQDVNYEWIERNCFLPDYPVTFIYGENSDYLSNGDFQKLSTIYPDSEFMQISNAGHWLHAEQPKLFLDAVISAIKQR